MQLFTLLQALYPKVDGPRVDMWEMDKDFHIFGYWSDGSKAGPNCPPEREIHISIQDDGDYEGNPDPHKFYEWLGKCRQNPDLLTVDGYDKEFIS